MILFAVVKKSIKIFLSKDKLKLLYMWEKNRGFILDMIFTEGFGEMLGESGSYIEVKSKRPRE